jgi:carotenoid 1,2-hydratase
LSDDGRHGLTIIAFIGSVFSPWYAWARRRGPADPMRHCAFNVSLYGGGTRRWTMTERDADAVRRDARTLCIGRSVAAWDGTSLTLTIAERGAPLPLGVRGVVKIYPLALSNRGFVLDAAGRHRWRPIAPLARIEVVLDSPSLSWSGTGYLDTNDGDTSLEDDFRGWDWCRAATNDDAAILYNARRRDGTVQSLAVRIDRLGRAEDMALPPPAQLPRTLWRLARPTRAEAGTAPRVIETLQDAPFYARSIITTRLLGQQVIAVHESLDLDRFVTLPVQLMLPFRVPRSLW